MDAVLKTELRGIAPPRRGKVRDIYDLGDLLLLVVTDRVSAFDVVLPNGIPGKGKILTEVSLFWFEQMQNCQAEYDSSHTYYTFAGVALENMDKSELIAAWHRMDKLTGFSKNERYERAS